MSKKGGTKHLKRLAVSKQIPVQNKKLNVFIANPDPGPHPKTGTMSLVSALRDILKVLSTAREARYILNKNAVKVDGKVRKEVHFPVGLMDVIEIEGDKAYRVIIAENGRLAIVPETKKKDQKVLKITNKVSAAKGIYQLTFHDGRTILVKDNAYRIGDSVLFDLGKAKIEAHSKLEPGANCLIVEGKHAGQKAKLKEQIKKGIHKEVILQKENEELITRQDYLFVLPEGW